MVPDYTDGLAPDGDYCTVGTYVGFSTGLLWLVDQVFNFFGFPGFISSITPMITTWATYLADSITVATGFVVQVLTLMFSTYIFVLNMFTLVISFFVSLINFVVGILDGTGDVVTGLGNVWTLINLGAWIGIVPMILVIAWLESLDKRAKQGQGYVICFWSDVSMMISAVSFFIDMSFRVINFVVDMAFRLIGVVASAVP
jgi:hypothetical protein